MPRMARKSEVMKRMDKFFNSSVAVIATGLTYLFGGWDTAIIVLIAFMALDYITGVVYAFNTKTLSSEIGL